MIAQGQYTTPVDGAENPLKPPTPAPTPLKQTTAQQPTQIAPYAQSPVTTAAQTPALTPPAGNSGNTFMNMPTGTPNLPMTPQSTWGGSPGNTFVNSVAGQSSPTSITPGTPAPTTAPANPAVPSSLSGLPVTPQSTWGGSPGNTFVNSVAGQSGQTVTPGTPAPSSTSAIPPVAGQAASLPTSSVLAAGLSSLAPGVNVTPTNASNDLRGQTITPGPATDRFAIAKSQLQNYNQATDPYYQQALREATSQAGGAGQLGSGQLRTGLGDLANQRNLQLETQGNSFLNNALSGSINDAYNNLGIAQQQQAYQTGAQNQTFNQGATTAGLQDSLLNSATNRGLAQLTAGNQGNPADTQLALSQLFGNQASQGGAALSSMIGNTVNKNAQTQNNSVLNQILASLGTGSPMVPPTTPVAPTPSSSTYDPNAGLFGGGLPFSSGNG